MTGHTIPFVRTIAFYTLVEAIRNRTLWFIALMIASGFGIALFLSQITLTETRQIQTAVLASVFRFGAIFILASLIITSIVREFNDKGLELMLSLPLPKSTYVIGKFFGFGICALGFALSLGIALLPLASPAQLLLWSISLFCELLIICAFSLFCILALEQIVSALAVVMGFYIMGRIVSTLQLVSHGPLSENTWAQSILGILVDTFAILLPRFDRFTQTEWLVNNSGQWTDLTIIIIQSIIYMVLLMSASLFDFYRKNF